MSALSQDAGGRPDRRGLALLALGVCALLLAVGCQSLGLNFLSHAKPDDKDPLVPEAALHHPTGAPGKNSFRLAPYVFLYDFDLKRDHPVFKELAGLRDQVYKELNLPPGNAVVQVYLFEDRDRYERFMEAHYPLLPRRRAFFVAQPHGFNQEDLYVYTFWGDRIQQDLRHELTHALLHSVIQNVPLWLDEGLAEYFELPPERKGVNGDHVQLMARPDFEPDLARLETLKQVKDMNPGEYREAWAWVHFLLKAKPESRTLLLGYLADLRSSPNPPPLAPRLAELFPAPEASLKRHLSDLDAGLRLAAASQR